MTSLLLKGGPTTFSRCKFPAFAMLSCLLNTGFENSPQKIANFKSWQKCEPYRFDSSLSLWSFQKYHCINVLGKAASLAQPATVSIQIGKFPLNSLCKVKTQCHIHQKIKLCWIILGIKLLIFLDTKIADKLWVPFNHHQNMEIVLPVQEKLESLQCHGYGPMT